MRRESILIYRQQVAAEVFAPLLESGVLAGTIEMGGINGAIQDAPTWRVIPTFLVLDICGVEDVEAAIGSLTEIAPQGETNLILIGEQDDVRFYRHMRDLGAAEYLPMPVSTEDLFEAIQRIAAGKATGMIDTSRCIAFIGARGGMGSSTLAAAAAKASAALHGKRTLLLDLDILEGAQHVYFDTEQTPAMMHMMESPDRIDAVFLGRSMVQASKDLFLLSMCDISANRIFPQEAVTSIVKQAQQGIDLVVLDMPARPQVEIEALFCAGTIFLVTTPTFLGLRDALALSSWLEGRNYPGKIVCVLNKTGESRTGVVPKDQFGKKLKCRVVELPFDPRSPGEAVMKNSTIFESRGPLGKAFKGVIEQMPTHVPVAPTFLTKLLGS